MMERNPFVGSWTYRSFLNDPKSATQPNDLLFGLGALHITEAAPDVLNGEIGGDGWGPLELRGSRTYGNPMAARFQGRGVVNGELWVYDYIAFLIPAWPDGVNQVSALVGSVIRTQQHSSTGGGVRPAGVVASFYAVRVPDLER
jgi:hypothetical protein